ncbi:MAG: hypothetical protein ACC707_11305 [Thiohalomonadales bacterium]
MTPVYMSPNLKQIEAIEAALHARGIDTSVIAKRQSANDSSLTPRSNPMHELWLKRQSDQSHAKTIITQEEFKMLRQDMKTIPPRNFNATQPVSKSELNSVAPVFSVTAAGRRRIKKDYWIPKNLVHVFKRLGNILGVAEPEMELSKFDKLYKPWDADQLMDSVEQLKKTCRPPSRPPRDS